MGLPKGNWNIVGFDLVYDRLFPYVFPYIWCILCFNASTASSVVVLLNTVIMARRPVVSQLCLFHITFCSRWRQTPDMGHGSQTLPTCAFCVSGGLNPRVQMQCTSCYASSPSAMSWCLSTDCGWSLHPVLNDYVILNTHRIFPLIKTSCVRA